ncbi:MAG: hypothetical protein UW30_C0003G0004 [Candidatus Giovannonibacteria bacterium GW2011_GWA2_44_13b]|uniref:Uncharacterized protein n=1 Tax=Candidatus Giovannonibacteria bacterium GW2011_GWA2_44_13b TaxID=1618647 RepID=A0A0G1K278_9BACT|nr:MAG: hypothetical protein UW30_C0003G0004 [Candidatus Giovannonibacteria bacterium GW2011_GWA2_44_13b]
MKNSEKITQRFIKKDIKLSIDFSEYINTHQDIFKDIPKNPCIIITDVNDKDFNEEKLKLSKEIKNKKSCFIAEKAGGKWALSPAT